MSIINTAGESITHLNKNTQQSTRKWLHYCLDVFSHSSNANRQAATAQHSSDRLSQIYFKYLNHVMKTKLSISVKSCVCHDWAAAERQVLWCTFCYSCCEGFPESYLMATCLVRVLCCCWISSWAASKLKAFLASTFLMLPLHRVLLLFLVLAGSPPPSTG